MTIKIETVRDIATQIHVRQKATKAILGVNALVDDDEVDRLFNDVALFFDIVDEEGEDTLGGGDDADAG